MGDRDWVIVQTSGGFGVLKPADGSALRKPWVIRPDQNDDRHVGEGGD